MSTPTSTDHRSRSRRKRPPSERNQAIYVAFRANGQSQAELAELHHLSQRRVSAIVRSVETWLADNGDVEPTEQRRLARSLDEARAEAIFSRALRAFDSAPAELVAHKKGERDGKPYHEESRRQQPPSSAMLRLALSAHRELSRLADKPPVEPSADEQRAERRTKVIEWLGQMRKEAVQAGKVCSDPDNTALMYDLVQAVVGDENYGVALAVLARDVGKEVVKQQPGLKRYYGTPPAAQRDEAQPGETQHDEEHQDAAQQDDGQRNEKQTLPLPPGEGRGEGDEGDESSDGRLLASDYSNCSNPSAAATPQPPAAVDVTPASEKSKTAPNRQHSSPRRRPPTREIQAWLADERLASAKNARAMREFYELDGTPTSQPQTSQPCYRPPAALHRLQEHEEEASGATAGSANCESGTQRRGGW